MHPRRVSLETLGYLALSVLGVCLSSLVLGGLVRVGGVRGVEMW